MTTKLHSGERPRSRAAATIAVLGLLLAFATPASATTSTGRGPSTTTDPYLLPVADGVSITSLLTVGDAGSASNGYEMVGVPDGLGAFQQGANLVLYMNQELRDNQGIARRHGQTGAFDTRLVMDPVSLEIKEGSDLINPGVSFWDYPSGTYVTAGARFTDISIQDTRFARFCSGTLSDPGLFYNEAAKVGYKGQLYFANEEDGDLGRAFAPRRATPSLCRGWGSSAGRTPSPPRTRPTRPWSSVMRMALAMAASCGSTSAPSRAQARRSTRPASPTATTSSSTP